MREVNKDGKDGMEVYVEGKGKKEEGDQGKANVGWACTCIKREEMKSSVPKRKLMRG